MEKHNQKQMELVEELDSHISGNVNRDPEFWQEMEENFPAFLGTFTAFRGIPDTDKIKANNSISCWSLTKDGVRILMEALGSGEKYVLFTAKIYGFNVKGFVEHMKNWEDFGYSEEPLRTNFNHEEEIVSLEILTPETKENITNQYYGVWFKKQCYYSEDGISIKRWNSCEEAYSFWKTNYKFLEKQYLADQLTDVYQIVLFESYLEISQPECLCEQDILEHEKNNDIFTIPEEYKKFLKF